MVPKPSALRGEALLSGSRNTSVARTSSLCVKVTVVWIYPARVFLSYIKIKLLDHIVLIILERNTWPKQDKFYKH